MFIGDGSCQTSIFRNGHHFSFDTSESKLDAGFRLLILELLQGDFGHCVNDVDRFTINQHDTGCGIGIGICLPNIGNRIMDIGEEQSAIKPKNE